MSEQPERPRLTRRQLREMEQARQAAAAQAAQPSSPPAPAPSNYSAPPAVPRPTMSRRQMREAAEREAAERAAAQHAADEQRRLADAQRLAEQHRQEEMRIRAQEEARRQMEAQVLAQRQAEEQAAREAQARALAERQRAEYEARIAAEQAAAERRLSAHQARQAAPPPLETEDAPMVRGMQQGGQRPGFYPAPTGQQPMAGGQVPYDHHGQPQVQNDVPHMQRQSMMNPPGGRGVIRTVDNTGEISPVLSTSPGEAVWPSAPGAVPAQDDFHAEQTRMQQAQAPQGHATQSAPFRAPAWGARTTQAQASMPAELDDEPAAAAPRSVFPGAAEQEVEDEFDLYDDEEPEEEYEPMFTWLRLLVLVIIAFVLGALVWLLIDNTSAGAAAASAALVVPPSWWSRKKL